MSLRCWFLSICATAVAAALVAALFVASGIRADEVVMLISRSQPAAVLSLLIATAAHVLLSGEKWRLVEERLSRTPPSRLDSFAYSAIGTAAGQVLPVQVASALSRGLGNRFYRGEHGGRAAAASVYEQMFDLAAVATLLVPGALALHLRSPLLFLLLAPPFIVAPLFFAGPLSRAAIRLSAARRGRLARAIAVIADKGLIDPQLLARLFLISVVRLCVLWAMTLLVGLAVGIPIPVLDLAVAIPFAVLASVLSLLPGGIGPNEWSFTAVLTWLGTPFPMAATWVVVNRLLTLQASLLVGLCGWLMLQRPKVVQGS